MEYGYVSVGEIEKLCNTDIRFVRLLQENPTPSFMTIDKFMRNGLADCIDEILPEINTYICCFKLLGYALIVSNLFYEIFVRILCSHIYIAKI